MRCHSFTGDLAFAVAFTVKLCLTPLIQSTFFFHFILFVNADEHEEKNNIDTDDGISIDSYAYDDDTNNDTSQTVRDGWQADDPYFYWPQDDSLVQKLNAEVQEMRAKATPNDDSGSIDPAQLVLICCLTLIGFSTAMLCTAIVLYYLKVNSLMHRYSCEGKELEAIIVSSEPNISESIEKVDEPDRRSMVDVVGTNDSDDNTFTVMTEDETMSYQRMINTSKDDSNDSSKSEGELDPWQHAAEKRDEQIQRKRGIHESDNNNFTLLRLASTKSKTRPLNTEKRLQFRLDHLTDERYRIQRNQKFRAVIEYQDDNNMKCMAKVRKNLIVMGEDIYIVESPNIMPNDFRIKLFVLKNYPMSGYPRGEVQRNQEFKRHLMYLVCLCFGFAVVGGGLYGVYCINQPCIFWTYIVLLTIQTPILHAFLGKSFDNILSSSYLNQGLCLTNEPFTTPFDREENISCQM